MRPRIRLAVSVFVCQIGVFCGAVGVVPPRQVDAGWMLGLTRSAVGLQTMLPQLIRAALPGMGNACQIVVKLSALVSVTGLIELLRQVPLAAGSIRQPFKFMWPGQHFIRSSLRFTARRPPC